MYLCIDLLLHIQSPTHSNAKVNFDQAIASKQICTVMQTVERKRGVSMYLWHRQLLVQANAHIRSNSHAETAPCYKHHHLHTNSIPPILLTPTNLTEVLEDRLFSNVGTTVAVINVFFFLCNWSNKKACEKND